MAKLFHFEQIKLSRNALINPRRACAARVTVLGSVCVCVCVCVCLSVSHISPTERLFVLKTLSRTQRATKVKKFVAICLKLLRSRVMPRNMSEKANMLIFRLTRGQFSPLDIQRSARGCLTIVNNIQPCPKRCLLMLLARVGARTECTTRLQLQYGAWPISAHAHWHSAQDSFVARRVK